MKNLIILLLILKAQVTIAQELDSEGYLQLDNIVSAITDKDDLQRADDIGYFKVLPQVKENQTPEESVSVEFFVGNYDGSDQSKNKLKFIQEIISDDKKVNPNSKAEVWGIAASGLDVNKTKEFTHIINTFGLQDADKKFENVPEYTFFNPYLNKDASISKKNNQRIPSSFTARRVTWILAKLTLSTGASYFALTMGKGLSPAIAIAVGVWPALASTGITIMNGRFGKFLTNGSWAKWLLSNETKFAKTIRKGLGLTPLNFEKQLLKNKKFLMKMRPDMHASTPELFEQKLRKITQDEVDKKASSLMKIAKKLGANDEYIKWYATEVAFTGVSIKIPQAAAGVGISASSTFIGESVGVLHDSAMGMMAQGPADLAIQNRKNNKIIQLEKLVKSKSVPVENIKELKRYYKMGLLTKDQLKNADSIIAKKSFEIANHSQLKEQIGNFISKKAGSGIGKSSHIALRRIELWTISRATSVSFAAMTGVILKVAQIPVIPDIILLSVGSTGAVYYANVKGWLTKDKIKYLFSKRFITNLKKTNLFSLSGLLHRLCAGKYTSKHVRI